MTLVVADGLLGIISDIAKSDPDGADVLIELGLIESLFDQIEEAGYFQVPLSKALDARTAKARRAIVRTYVEKRVEGQDVDAELRAAAAVTAVSSAIHKAKKWDPRKHPRNPQSGRFTEVIGGEGVSFQGHRQHLARQLVNWRDSGFVNPGTKVAVHGAVVDPEDQSIISYESTEHTVPRNTQHPLEGLPDDFLPQMLEVHPNDTNARGEGEGRVFDVAQHVTSPENAHRVARATKPISNAQGFGNELDTFMRGSSEGDRRAWRQVHSTGRAISALSRPGSTGHAVGSLAQVVGELGPQAERVLGPGIRRTAYRYRGTERRPDAGLVRDVAYANEPTMENQGRAGYLQRRGVDLETDQIDLRLRGDAASSYFIDRLPDEEQTTLSIESGQVPPSQGAIIDADGDVSTEAMGFQGDHYLPFDLKNLKRLKGGQYVRTRAAGGPTSEDIYTGLLTGARQFQVVSNSGVFTVDFDPDLRGGKRVSDKARAMVGRYTKLLNAINTKGLYAQDLDTQTVRALREQALDEVGPEDPQAVDDRFQELKRQERLKREIQGPTDEEIAEAAERKAVTEFQQSGSKPSLQEFRRRVRDISGEMLDAEKENRVKAFKLDGQGYYAALRSLQQEFPYFIRSVDYESLPDFANSRGVRTQRQLPKGSGGPDRGYVGPGQLTPFDTGRGTGTPRTEQSGTGEPQTRSAAPPAASVRGRTSGSATTSGSGGLTAAAAAQLGDMKRGLTRTLAEAKGGIEALTTEAANPAQDESDEQVLDYEGATPNFVRVMNARHKDVGNWLATAPLDQAKAYVGGLSDAADTLPSTDAPEHYAERVAAAHQAAEAVLNAREPFEQVEPLSHAPEDTENARPAFHADIDKLGTDDDKYGRYLAANPDVDEALRGLGSSPAQKVSDLTYQWQKANEWLDAGPNAPKPSNRLPFKTQAEARRWVDDPKTRKSIEAMHKAWAFQTARKLAGQLRGDAGPKAPDEPQGAVRRTRHMQESEVALRDDPALRWGRQGQLEVAKALLSRWTTTPSRSSRTRRTSTRS